VGIFVGETQMTNEIKTKLERFAAQVQAAALAGLIRDDVDCEGNRNRIICTVKYGRKFARVDRGGSGWYMVELATEEIFGIKAYGVVHRGHRYGTLDAPTCV